MPSSPTPTRYRAIAAVACLLLIGGSVLGWQLQSGARQDWKRAQALFAAGDISKLLALINQSKNQGQVTRQELILGASCARRFSQTKEFEQWLDQANQQGANEADIQLERRLFDVYQGNVDETPTRLLRELTNLGADDEDLRHAAAIGYIAKGRTSDAKTILDEWQNQKPDSTHRQYAMAVYWRSMGKMPQAVTALRTAIDLNARNELAYLALSEIFANPPLLSHEKNSIVLEALVTEFPENVEGRARLARTLRQLGDARRSKELLDRSENAARDNLELAEVEFDLGNYARSLELLAEAGLSTTADYQRLADQVFQFSLAGQSGAGDPLTKQISLAATAYALSGKADESLELFRTFLNRVARLRRYIDLVAKQPIYPNDSGLMAAIDAILDLERSPSKIGPQSQTAVAPEVLSLPGYQLYVDECSVCHGEAGDGAGSAARHLHPLPRNFLREPMRYISSQNGLATDDDLRRTILHGLEDTSMPGYQNLGDQAVQELVAVIRAFQRLGLEEAFDAHSPDLQETVDRHSWVANKMNATQSVDVPEFASPTAQQLAEGRLTYDRAGCGQCHPLAGASAPRLFDNNGQAIASRDFAVDPFRTGRDEAELYKRILLGIPGTPHPSFTSKSDKELQNLVHFVLSLQQAGARTTNNYQRLRRAVERQQSN